MEKLKIIIATHKLYNIPDDDIYFPIFVGSIGKKDILNYDLNELISKISTNYKANEEFDTIVGKEEW